MSSKNNSIDPEEDSEEELPDEFNNEYVGINPYEFKS
jgi:hypothetical protein